MDSRLIALAIPFFFLLIGVEVVVSRVQRVRRYRLHDAIASIGCGIGEQVIVVFTAGLSVAAYSFAERHLALQRVSPSSVLGWVVVFPLLDHSYYWFHRASHRVNFLWAGHAVHHQSEEYNLSTALRQNWIENLLAWPFYLPLALLGFPLAMFAVASTVQTLYQFWIHTRAIGRLGVAEGVMNTPSSHRVHHGVDPKYVDTNYGGMFMLWDRVYGTYVAEEEEPIYGTVKPLESWSPLWANVEGWVRLWSMARATHHVVDKVRVWFRPPDWRPRDLGGPVTVPEVDRAAYRKFETEVPRAVDRYVLSQFVVVTVVTSAIMWFSATLPPLVTAAASLWVIVALVSWGALFEGKRWAAPLEVARHVAGVVLALVASGRTGAHLLVWAATLSATVSLALYFSSDRRRVPQAA